MTILKFVLTWCKREIAEVWSDLQYEMSFSDSVSMLEALLHALKLSLRGVERFGFNSYRILGSIDILHTIVIHFPILLTPILYQL